MLRELKNVRQIPGEPDRRWFSASDMDLIVWEREGHMKGFQFCYIKDGHPYSLTWLRDRDFFHDYVDDGDVTARGGKMTPICIPDGNPDMAYVYELFLTSASFLDADIRLFIARVLRRYPRRPEPSTWSRAG